MKARVVGGMLLGAAILAGPVHAAELDLSNCKFPAKPAVPDGSKASEDEMVNASGAIKVYLAESQKGRDCLDAAKAALGEEPMTEEQQAQYTIVYNASVDADHAVGDAWNQAVKAYKAQNP